MNNISLKKDRFVPNFFDEVEDKFIKINLLKVAEVAILLMQTIFKVNETEKQLTFCDNFVEELKVLKEENNQLNNLLKSDFPSPENKR
jgi:hypothetical protein